MKPTPVLWGAVAAGLLVASMGCSDSDASSQGGDALRPASSERTLPERSGQIEEGAIVPQIPEAEEDEPLVRRDPVAPPGDEGAAGNRRVAATATPSTGQSDWPCWQGPNGNGISSETGLIRSFLADGPRILWKARLGTGFSGISVAGGRVFTLFGRDGRERVACFDSSSGRQLWEVDSDVDFAQGDSSGPRATPCVDGERVYAIGASGRLLCLETATGEQVWSLDLYDEFTIQPHTEGLSPSPLIEGNKLIVLAGTLALALDKSNGSTIWKSLDEPMNHVSPTVATIEENRQLLVLTGSNLVGLSLENGSELWRHPQQGVNIATPVVGPGNRIFAAAAYGFGSQLIEIANGAARQVYKNDALASHHASPVLYDGCLYGFHDRVGILKCVDFASGEERWESRDPGKGKLIIADGQMILLTENGELVLAPVSPDGFSATATAQLLRGTCYTAPSLANGKLYLRSDQEMVCVDVKE